MIQRLGASSLSFKGTEVNSVRNAYKEKVDENIRIQQNQNMFVSKNVQNTVQNTANNNRIAMQGKSCNGQNIDVVV